MLFHRLTGAFAGSVHDIYPAWGPLTGPVENEANRIGPDILIHTSEYQRVTCKRWLSEALASFTIVCPD